MGDVGPDEIRVFISYAHEDRAYVEALSKHLQGMVQEGMISAWDDAEIKPGQDWNRAILEQLDAADLILLLVSSDFLASKYAYAVELKQAIRRQEESLARVIPIAIRPCLWRGTPLAKLQGLPRDLDPVSNTGAEDRDRVYAEIASEIFDAVETLRQSRYEWPRRESRSCPRFRPPRANSKPRL